MTAHPCRGDLEKCLAAAWTTMMSKPIHFGRTAAKFRLVAACAAEPAGLQIGYGLPPFSARPRPEGGGWLNGPWGPGPAFLVFGESISAAANTNAGGLSARSPTNTRPSRAKSKNGRRGGGRPAPCLRGARPNLGDALASMMQEVEQPRARSTGTRRRRGSTPNARMRRAGPATGAAKGREIERKFFWWRMTAGRRDAGRVWGLAVGISAGPAGPALCACGGWAARLFDHQGPDEGN
jgi:hypothetical protein